MYPLAGLARCGVCSGAIVSSRIACARTAAVRSECSRTGAASIAIGARRTPKELAEIIDRVEATAARTAAICTRALRDKKDLRHVFHALFPSGLSVQSPGLEWKIEGEADLALLTRSSGESWFRSDSDPDGIRTRVTGVKGRCPRPSGRRGLVE
jgi:hypothetical protein